MNSHVNPSSSRIIETKQDRGQRTQDRLVAATLKLLRDRVFEDLSVAEISKAAGVAVGSFYRRFTTKDAILPLLYDHYEVTYREWQDGLRSKPAFASDSLEARLQALVHTTLAFFSEQSGLIRALHLHSRLNPSITPQGSTDRRANDFSDIAELIGDAHEPIDRRRDEKARAVGLILISTLTEFVVYARHTPARAAGLSKKALVEQLTAALVAVADR